MIFWIIQYIKARQSANRMISQMVQMHYIQMSKQDKKNLKVFRDQLIRVEIAHQNLSRPTISFNILYNFPRITIKVEKT